MRPLPIGISTLAIIREYDMVYVDKTPYAYQMTALPGRYFLSRPRRFGKSLFVDTLKGLFEGNRTLFEGLYIYDKWDWEQKYPVIKLDFVASGARNREELDMRITYMLHSNAERLGVLLKPGTDIPGQFTDLILGLTRKYESQVVLLIDEYDKPLLDNIERPEVLEEIREGLKALYSVIKDQDANLQFVFITGVSKFSKVSIFSGINNLKDITLNRDFADICGYTQGEVEHYFAEHLAGINWEKLKRWYNGYNFLGESVYNPFDILLFISEHQTYRSYWFETGTPTFLIKLFQENRYFLPDLETLEVGEEILSTFDIHSIDPVTLLFQTGYLTIKTAEERFGKEMFTLQFPNFEVRTSFSEYLIGGYTRFSYEKMQYQKGTYDALLQGDLPALERTIVRLFAAIPYRNFTNNELVQSEGYYASVLYAFLSATNCQVIPEDITNHGQADLTVMLGDRIYVMEIKVIQGAAEEPEGQNSALRQIQERGYAEKYRGKAGKSVYEVGLIFSTVERNLVKFDYQMV